MVGLFEVLNVLRGLAPVEPFSTDPGDGQPCEEDDEEMETVKKSKKKAQKAKKAKKHGRKCKQRSSKTKKTAQANQPVARPGLQGQPNSSAYEAKSFNESRKRFIEAEMANNSVKFREASTRWMLSNERASLLEGLSAAELKRRKFA